MLLTWIIFVSIIIHGVSGVPFTKLLSPGMDLSEEHAREAAAKAAAAEAAEAAAAAADGGVIKELAASGDSSSGGEVALQVHHLAAAGAGAAAAATAARSGVAKAAGGVRAWFGRLAAAVGCCGEGGPAPAAADTHGLRAAGTAGGVGGSSRYAMYASPSLRAAGAAGGTARVSFAPRRYHQLATASVPLPAAAAAGGAVGNGSMHRNGSQQRATGRQAAVPQQVVADAEAPPPRQPLCGEAEMVSARA